MGRNWQHIHFEPGQDVSYQKQTRDWQAIVLYSNHDQHQNMGWQERHFDPYPYFPRPLGQPHLSQYRLRPTNGLLGSQRKEARDRRRENREGQKIVREGRDFEWQNDGASRQCQ